MEEPHVRLSYAIRTVGKIKWFEIDRYPGQKQHKLTTIEEEEYFPVQGS